MNGIVVFWICSWTGEITLITATAAFILMMTTMLSATTEVPVDYLSYMCRKTETLHIADGIHLSTVYIRCLAAILHQETYPMMAASI